MPGLRDLGFADAWRTLHGYDRKEPSWVFSHGGGWRLDHAFVSADLEAVAATYHHGWRDAGLSDHSAARGGSQAAAGSWLKRSRASSRVIARLPQRTSSA